MEYRLETAEIDVEKVMEQIRENVRKRRQGWPPSKAASPPPTAQEVADLTSLHRDHDIYPQGWPPSKAASPPPTAQEVADLTSLHRDHDIYPLRFTSHRRVLGHFVVLAKKMLQPGIEQVQTVKKSFTFR